MALVYLNKLRGVRVRQDGVDVANAGRVAGLDFLDSVVTYDTSTGYASIELGGTLGDLGLVALTGASNTLALVQARKLVGVSHTAASTLTVPANATVAFPVGVRILVEQVGAGQVTIAAGIGVTIRTASSLKLRAQYSVVELIKIATNEWIVSGDLVVPGELSALASNATVPFDIPNAGSFIVPTGMTLTFGQCYAGDVFIIDAWVQVSELGGNARDVDARVYLDGATLLTTALYEVAANGFLHFPVKYVHTLASDNASPDFAIGYRADGAGPDVTAGSISVTRIRA